MPAWEFDFETEEELRNHECIQRYMNFPNAYDIRISENEGGYYFGKPLLMLVNSEGKHIWCCGYLDHVEGLDNIKRL